MSEEVLYTPDELAHKLKLSKYTIYEMIKRGEIPAHHVGRSIRVSESQLEHYLMRTRKADNVYDAEIFQEDDGLQYALAPGNVKVYVNTELSGKVKICISPKDVIIGLAPIQSSARNMLAGKVISTTVGKKWAKVVMDVGFPLLALITHRSLKDLDIKTGDVLYAIFKTTTVKVIG